VDGVGVRVLFHVYRHADRGVCICQEPERAVAGHAGQFYQRQVKIPLAQVSDGDLHRFQAQENGTAIRFWLYQKPDGKIATVFDACQILRGGWIFQVRQSDRL